MKKSKTILAVTIIISVLLLTVTVTFIKSTRSQVAAEGYDTDEAAWNYIVRSGEIRFLFSENVQIISLESEQEVGSILSPNEAVIKLGYGMFTTTLKYTNDLGELQTLTMNTDKFNNWNRVLYTQHADGSFIRLDNGVRNESVHTIVSAEQDASPNH